MSAPLSSSTIKTVHADKLKAVVDLDIALGQLSQKADNLLTAEAQAQQGLVHVRLCQVILIEQDSRHRSTRYKKYFPTQTYRKKMQQVGNLILQHETDQEVIDRLKQLPTVRQLQRVVKLKRLSKDDFMPACELFVKAKLSDRSFNHKLANTKMATFKSLQDVTVLFDKMPELGSDAESDPDPDSDGDEPMEESKAEKKTPVKKKTTEVSGKEREIIAHKDALPGKSATAEGKGAKAAAPLASEDAAAAASEEGKDEEDDEDDDEDDADKMDKAEKKSVRQSERIKGLQPDSAKTVTASSSSETAKNAPTRKRKTPPSRRRKDSSEDAEEETKEAKEEKDKVPPVTSQQVRQALMDRMKEAVGPELWSKLQPVEAQDAKPLQDFKGAPLILVKVSDVEGDDDDENDENSLAADKVLSELQFDKTAYLLSNRKDQARVQGLLAKASYFEQEGGVGFTQEDTELKDKLDKKDSGKITASAEDEARERLLFLNQDKLTAEQLIEHPKSLHLPSLVPQNYGKGVHKRLQVVGQKLERQLGFSSMPAPDDAAKPKSTKQKIEEHATECAGDGTRVDRIVLGVRGGMGYDKPQDKLAHAHARTLNYMLKCSRGALLWFGFFLKDVRKAFNGNDDNDTIKEDVIGNENPVKLLQLLLSKDVPVWLAEQLPGQAVIRSAHDDGSSMLAILGAGDPIMNMEWNDAFKIEGMKLTKDTVYSNTPAKKVPWLRYQKYAESKDGAKDAGLDASTFNRSEALKAEEKKKAAIEKYAVAEVKELLLYAPAMGCSGYADNSFAHNLDLYHIGWTCLDCFAKRFPGPRTVAGGGKDAKEGEEAKAGAEAGAEASEEAGEEEAEEEAEEPAAKKAKLATGKAKKTR